MRRAVLLTATAVLLLTPTVLAFFSGGYFDEPRLIATLTVWSVVLLVAVAGPRPLPASAPGRAALAGLALLTIWTAASVSWAPLSDPATDSAVRLVLYLGAFVAAAALLRDQLAARAVEPALAAGALVVIGYGLSERLLPGLVGPGGIGQGVWAARAADHLLERGGRARRDRIGALRSACGRARPADRRSGARRGRGGPARSWRVPLVLTRGDRRCPRRAGRAARRRSHLVAASRDGARGRRQRGGGGVRGRLLRRGVAQRQPRRPRGRRGGHARHSHRPDGRRWRAAAAAGPGRGARHGGDGAHAGGTAPTRRGGGSPRHRPGVLVAGGLAERGRGDDQERRRGVSRLASVESRRYDYWRAGLDAYSDAPSTRHWSRRLSSRNGFASVRSARVPSRCTRFRSRCSSSWGCPVCSGSR